MRTAQIRAWGLALALTITMPLSACSVYPGPASRHTAMAQTALGRVTVDLGILAGLVRPVNGRMVLATSGLDPVLFPIGGLRVSVTGPEDEFLDVESNPVYKETISWSPSQSADAAPAPNGQKLPSLLVPSGVNRVFLVEVLGEPPENGEPQTLLRMRAAATVPAGGNVTVKLNFAEDAVARTIQAILDEPPASDSEHADLLASDLTAPLRSYVVEKTGFVESNNTYNSALGAPQYIQARTLAGQLKDQGLARLTATETAFDPSGMDPTSSPLMPNSYSSGGWASDISETNESDAFEVILLAPMNGAWMQTAAVDGDSFSFTGVPDGEFTIALKRVGSNNVNIGEYTFSASSGEIVLPPL